MSARKKAAAPKRASVRTPSPKRKTVTFEQVSTVAMTCGGEDKHPVVIHDGVVKTWVGIGWVGQEKARAEDYDVYPEVVSKKQTKRRK